eukprot:762972-Hanusia_phi.AAC.4
MGYGGYKIAPAGGYPGYDCSPQGALKKPDTTSVRARGRQGWSCSGFIVEALVKCCQRLDRVLACGTQRLAAAAHKSRDWRPWLRSCTATPTSMAT